MPSMLTYRRSGPGIQTCTWFIIGLFLGVSLAFDSAAGSSTAQDLTMAARLHANMAVPSAVKSMDMPAALQRAASMSAELAQFSVIPAVPVPHNLSKIPAYRGVAQLAQALPIVQAGIAPPETEQLVSEFIAQANVSASGTSLSGRAAGLRVLIVGDSITQGQQGDYTWRYRIWQWFQSQGIAVSFVGPYTGTFIGSAQAGTPLPPQPPPLYGSTSGGGGGISVDGKYAANVDAGFLSNNGHFANWGRAMAVDQGMIQNVLANNPADIILVALGFNDMGWYYSDCYGLIDSAQLFISKARAANPNIKILMANVPQRTFIRPDLVTNTTTYNNILPNYISQWSTAQSPVRLVEFAQNYACGTTDCPGGYDGLHPNAWGEWQIANAFSKALIAGFGIGSTPLPIPAQTDPSLTRPLPVPSNFQVFTSPQGVSATWDPVFGASNYDVSVSINGGGGGFSPGSTTTNRWDSQWPLDGWSYAVSVRASVGNQHGGYTGTQTAVAHPQLAPPPNNVQVTPTNGGFTVTWDPPTGPYTDSIVEYNIIYWDIIPTDCQFLAGAAFKSSPAVISGLLNGKNYLIAPVTWNANGQGLPYFAPNAVPGYGAPPVPSGLTANSLDGTSLHLEWQGSNVAGGYEVFIRNATGGQHKSIANTSQTCNDEYFLYPGTETYQFGVVAYNGNNRLAQTASVIPLKATGTSAGPTCAPAPPWCPGGSGGSGGYVGGCSGCGGGGSGGGGTGSGGGSGGGGTTVVGGTTTVVGGTTTVIGGTTIVGGTTTVVGGSTRTTTSGGSTITTRVGGTTSVVGGSTVTSTTLRPTTTSSTAAAAVPTNIPSGTDGQCTGPGCNNGRCTSLLCISFGCKGTGCNGGICTRGSACIEIGCIGPNCVDGVCKGSGCLTKGCVGPDCNSGTGRCIGPNCLALGCSGADCGSNGICIGPNCSEVTCGGLDCANGGCVGPACTPYDTGVGGGSGAPQNNPNDGCGSNGNGVTTAPSCSVTCQSVSATQSCTTNCQTTTGCSVTATTKTTTLSSNAYLIPTPFPDSYSVGSNAFIESAVSAAMASEDQVDSSTVTYSTTTVFASTTTVTVQTPEPSQSCSFSGPSFACNAEKTIPLFCDCGGSFICSWRALGMCGQSSCHADGENGRSCSGTPVCC